MGLLRHKQHCEIYGLSSHTRLVYEIRVILLVSVLALILSAASLAMVFVCQNNTDGNHLLNHRWKIEQEYLELTAQDRLWGQEAVNQPRPVSTSVEFRYALRLIFSMSLSYVRCNMGREQMANSAK